MLDRAWVWRDSNVRYFRVESVLFYVESSDVYHRVKPYPCTAGQGNGVPLNKNQTQGSGRFPFIEIKYGGRNYNFDSTHFVAKAAKQRISIYKRWFWCYFVKHIVLFENLRNHELLTSTVLFMVKVIS